MAGSCKLRSTSVGDRYGGDGVVLEQLLDRCRAQPVPALAGAGARSHRSRTHVAATSPSAIFSICG